MFFEEGSHEKKYFKNISIVFYPYALITNKQKHLGLIVVKVKIRFKGLLSSLKYSYIKIISICQ